MEKKNVTLTKLNPWKAAFLFLVAVLIGGFLLLFTRLTQERENVSQIIAENVVREGDPVITSNSNKEQVNRFVDFYLADLQKDASIGALGLPINQVLKMIQNNSEIPEWIDIQPKEEMIILRLDQFELKNGMFFRADKINLVDNEIQLNVYLPE